MPPFTTEQFLTVFEQYNVSIWPLQPVAYMFGLVAVDLAIRRRHRSNWIISAILALFWLWMGVVYHLMFFREINAAATVFGALFNGQAIVF